MPSAMTAESSDSIAPSMAIANAAGSSSRIRPKPSGAVAPRQRRAAGAPAGCRRRSTPSTVVWKRRADRRDVERRARAGASSATAAATAAIAISGAGTLRVSRGQREQQRERRRAATPSSPACAVARALPQRGELARRSARAAARSSRPSDVLELERRDHDGDAGVKPVVTGYGMNWIRLPEPRDAHDHQQHARHQARRSAGRRQPVLASTIGARITTNAAVGPVTWNLQPPSSATTAPATIAV